MKLINDDCLKILPNILDNSIDLILTDPPYGTTQCKWDSIIPFEPMWKELKRIIKDNSCIALFGSEPFSSYLRTSNIKWFKYDWIWHKNKPTGMLNAKKQPMRNFENISIFYKKQCFYNPIKENREHKKPTLTAKCYSKNNVQNQSHKDTERKILNKKRYPTQIKKFDTIPDRSKMLHPTQKPVALLEYLIKTYTNENDIVLDFTMGSGSTGVACKNLNRKFIGIEKDTKYFEIAKNRIESILC